MKRIFTLLAVFAVAVSLTSCVTGNKALLIAPEEKTASQSGASPIGAKSQDGLQIVAGSDYFDCRNANFMVSLASLNESSFTFSDSDIAIYGGNSDKGNWTLIERWNSTDYQIGRAHV